MPESSPPPEALAHLTEFWGHTGQRMLVIDVEPNKLVHREPPVQVSHGAFKYPRILRAVG